ncbi:MAG TPA: hypothetical protein VJ951_09040 [Bacteroidales bacterium]|nr:hypothetical protein [Bacteroidales bacterium]
MSNTKNIGILLISVILFGCRPCEPETYNMGEISDEALLSVPYTINDKPVLKHSNGQEISFSIDRITKDKTEYLCGHRCCDMLLYQENVTTMLPDKKLIKPVFHISNFDSTYVSISVQINRSSFNIPAKRAQMNDIAFVDSMTIEGNMYYNVFKLGYIEHYIDSENPIFIDSLYYNYNKGILKISLSNNEFYALAE